MTNEDKTKPDAAIIYCRVSSEKQKEEGHGLDAQESNCRKFAKEVGLEVEKCFKDSFTGGGDFWKRPELSSLINYLDDNPHKDYAVLISDLDRLARDTQSHMEIRTELKARNVELKCLNYKLDNSPEGKFVETVFAGKNQLEREQNRRRVIKKQRARLEDGYWPFTQPPGYVYDIKPEHGKILIPHDKTASIYAEGLKRFANGRFNNREELRQFLEDAGIADIEGTNGVSYSKANRLLRRVIYAGYIEYPKWDISRREGQHEALINLQTFKKIQRRLENGGHLYPNRKDVNPDFPARGLVVCSGCMKPFTGSVTTGNGGKYWYYRCNNTDCKFGGKSIQTDRLHKGLEGVLAQIEPTEGAVNLAERIMKDVWQDYKENKENREAEIQKKINQKEDEIDILVEKTVSANSERIEARYESKIEKLDKEQQLLKEKLENNGNEVQIETAIEEVCDFLKNPEDKWNSGDVYNKRAVLKAVFETKPAFHKEEGFETTKKSLPLEVFEIINKVDSHDVRAGRIELPAHQWQ